MAFESKSLDDYIDVPTRIAEFRALHPDGSLQPADPSKPYEIVTVEGATFVVYAAAAYRSADDIRPGIGMAWEPVPGHTRNSELMNAETSAWGRAIVAALAADSKRGIASQQEVRNRQAERDQPQAQTGQAGETTQHFSDLIKVAGGRPEIARLVRQARESGADMAAVGAAAEERQKTLSSGPPTNKDGSLSRSRMSDDELDAAGAMTRDQLREHNRLAREAQANPKLADRATGPDPDDPWTKPEVPSE
jgi:hypothetical protein